LRLRSHPGLRIVATGDENAIVRHPETGAHHVVDAAVPALLELLREPAEWSSLTAPPVNIPDHVLRGLVESGLLRDDGDVPAFDGWFRPLLPTFTGAPSGPPGSARISVVGVPFDSLSVTGSGAASGPGSLRLASSVGQYTVDAASGVPNGVFDYYHSRRILEGVTVADAGDLIAAPGERLAEIGWRLAEAVRECRRRSSFPLVLGGDHSLTLWSVSGLSRQPISLLHLDAHSDLAPTSPSGLPSNADVVRWLLEQPHVERLASVGLRGYLPGSQELSNDKHRLLTTTDVLRGGPPAVLELLPADLPCYVTLDLDVLDPSCAPGTNSPVPGGLSFDVVRELLETVAAKRDIVGCDVVELNPERDPYLGTARIGAYLALALAGAVFAR
jgi:agmatinase